MSIADKLTYLNTTKQLLKTEINKINNVLDDNSTFRSYPQELFNGYLDILNNGTDTLWNNLEKVSASGEEATLENVENAPIKMVLNGNTSQETTTGKNLLKLGAGETHLGITSVINANGSISYSGTAESSYCKLGTEVNVNIPAGTYAFSRNERLNYGTRILITFEDNTTTNPTIASGNLAATFTTTQTIKKIQVYLITLTANTTYNGTQYLQLESGSTATSWEKYTGGQPSPNPDYPQQVKVVKGENVVSVSGKNLIDQSNVLSTLTYNSETGYYEGTSTSAITTALTGIFEDNVQYTFKYLGYKENAETEGLQARFTYTDGTENHINFPLNTTAQERSITSLNGKTVASFGIRYLRQRSIHIKDLMLYRGTDINTPYVPYSKTDYPINLGDIELCKINTYKDYFYKDSGKWYVHKEIGKYQITGQESAGFYWNNEIKGMRLILDNAIKAIANAPLYCNRFRAVQSVSHDNNYVRLNRTASEAYAGFWFGNISIAGVSDETTFKTYARSNDIILYYPLATPTETEITNSTLIEQLEAISKAKSVKDKTYITQTNDELPFILDVEAIKEYSVQ